MNSKLIGEGTYGKVFKIEDPNGGEPTIFKQCSLFEKCSNKQKKTDECLLNIRNIKEIIILNSLNAPFIPLIKGVEIQEEKDDIKLLIYQKYCGQTLYDFISNLTPTQRSAWFPVLFIQLIRSICWLKKHNLSHMDIKPENICIDDYGNITLIDFGIASPVSKYSPCYFGTLSYADPSYHGYMKQVNYPYDIFSAGLIAFYILNGNDELYDSMNEDFTQMDLYDMVKLTKGKLFNKLNEQEKNILINMIDLDEDNRMTAEEIYNSVLFTDQLRQKYPLYNETKSEFDTFFERSDTFFERSDTFFERWGQSPLKINSNEFHPNIMEALNVMLSITKKIKKLNFLYNYSYRLFMIISSCINTLDSKLELMKFGLACLFIGNIIFECDIECYKIINAYNKLVYPKDFIKLSNMIEYILGILIRLNWKVCPSTWNF